MLVEIHMLHNYAPNNLNRDDTGSPKRCNFGGYPRARVSSQSLKYAIRKSPIFQETMKDFGIGIRTRHLPDLVKEKLIERGISEDFAIEAAQKATGFGNKDAKETKDYKTKQIMFFSQADIEKVTDVIEKAIKNSKDIADFKKKKAKDLQNEIKKMGIIPITADISLFGRMITSEAFVDKEASMQVAHAISTNKIFNEFDFFTAVDDLQQRGGDMEDQGSAMMGDIEFNSSCFYKYFSFDTEQFIDNFESKNDSELRNLMVKTIEAFLKAAIFTSPSGKQNTFAAHQLPAVVAVVVRPMKCPVSFANAFVSPASPYGKKDLEEVSVEKLVNHINTLSKRFNLEATHQFWFEGRDFNNLEESIPKNFEKKENIQELVDSLTSVLQGD
ncbi:MAG: type I-E CRISPR-associated protein Cas7/Cse4/CasC [Promethearchaeia archaeon]|nr:MAG: type I-E CRISPR-associated protein Cas7/Cse4/CasC [Candidatus Lokiarchaeia archaeon]